MTTVVRLRAHHLLCLLTFVGEGYSAVFVEQLTAVARRVAAGARIELVDGPDEICMPLVGADGDAHCVRERARSRDELARAALFGDDGPFAGRTAAPPLTGDALAALRAAFASGRVRAACSGCEWFDLCTAVAARDFSGVLPHDQEPPA